METTGTGADRGTATVVRVREATVTVRGRRVLHDVTLTVTPGELVALLGANGAGKSTLVHAMTGLQPLSGGQVELFGTPVERFRDWHRVGFAPQRPGAASGVPASVREVVASGRLSRRRLLRPAGRADRAAVARALEVVGLSDLAHRTAGELSGGQQQRVLLARALAGEPEVLFLDEPTAGVDLPSQRALARALAALRERGATIVLVAHDLGPMQPLVDRAVVLRDGRVVRDGPPPGSDGGVDAGE